MSVCLYVGLISELCKTGEPIEKPFGVLTHLGPTNNVLDVDQDRPNPFTVARGDKSAMRPFAKLLWTLVMRLGSKGRHGVICR